MLLLGLLLLLLLLVLHQNSLDPLGLFQVFLALCRLNTKFASLLNLEVALSGQLLDLCLLDPKVPRLTLSPLVPLIVHAQQYVKTVFNAVKK